VDDEEATLLTLVTLFEIRGKVRDIHNVIVGEKNGEGEEDDA
jgi:hypothetical protein